MKKLVFSFSLVAMMATFSSCSEETKPVAVAFVRLNPTTVTLIEGATLELTADVRPSAAENKAVTWTSSNSEVASVKEGVVTAVEPGGPVTITVTTVDGGKTATCTVTVEPVPPEFPANLTGLMKNTERPFSYYGECVHNNRSWMVSDWTVNDAAAPSGNVYDNIGEPTNAFNGSLSMVGYSSWPAGTYANGKLYQTVELERGTYKFSAFVFRSIGTYKAYVVAASGNDLPDTDDAEQDALDCVSIHTGIQFDDNTELFVEFTLSEKSTVSLGFVVSFTGQGEFYFNKVELWQTEE